MTGVVVDPRLRQRRIDVARAEGRRRLRRAVVLVVLAVVFAIAIAVAFSPLLDVDRIEVGGATRTSVGAVLDAGGLELGSPLITFDASAVAEGVATLAWVSEVTVDRSWDGTIAITIVEREPVAALIAGDDAVLVDRHGQVLAEVGSAPASLPTITAVLDGPTPGDRVDAELLPLLVLAARIVDDLDLDPGVLQYDDGDVMWVVPDVGRIRFGGVTDLDAKLIALGTVLGRLDGVIGGELDLRVPSTAVRRLDNPPATAEPDPNGVEGGSDR